MTVFTFRRELGCSMIRLGRLVIVIQVATGTGIGRIDIIPVMAECAIVLYGYVSACNGIIIVVNAKGGRRPAGIRSMAILTIVGQRQRIMIRVD